MALRIAGDSLFDSNRIEAIALSSVHDKLGPVVGGVLCNGSELEGASDQWP